MHFRSREVTKESLEKSLAKTLKRLNGYISEYKAEADEIIARSHRTGPEEGTRDCGRLRVLNADIKRQEDLKKGYLARHERALADLKDPYGLR